MRVLRRALIAFLLLISVAAAVVSPVGPADAASSTSARYQPRQSVDFDIVGFRCSFEVTSERKLRNGTTVLKATQIGETDASIALMDGTLTVKSTAYIRADGNGFTVGRWTMEPDASTGTISGWFRGSISGPEETELTSIGWGRGALKGTRVKMVTSTPASSDGAPCETDLAFEGSGSASDRPDKAPTGAVVVTSTKSFTDSVADLTAAIENNPNLGLVGVVNHQAAAASRDLVLPPTTELFFGNPRLGTPLMQVSQTTGIDLPQKILIWEDLLGVVHVGYNAPAYLQSRHSLDGVDQQLQTIAGALANLAGVASGTTVDPVFDAGRVSPGEGLVTITSKRSAADAYAAIVAALEAAPPVNVAITLEHDANAARVGLELRPTKLVVFGNPSLGTVLMQTDQAIALDLPQKILVYEDADGETVIAYNDANYIADRHGLKGQDDILKTLNGALANFANAGS